MRRSLSLILFFIAFQFQVFSIQNSHDSDCLRYNYTNKGKWSVNFMYNGGQGKMYSMKFKDKDVWLRWNGGGFSVDYFLANRTYMQLNTTLLYCYYKYSPNIGFLQSNI